MKTPTVKPGTFESDPRDQRRTVEDVYNEPVLESRNAITGTSEEVESASSYMSSIDFDVDATMKSITENVGKDGGGLTFDFTETRKRIESAMGVPGVSADMDNIQKKSVADAIADNSDYNSKVVIDGVSTVIDKDIDNMSVSDFVSTVNSVSGNNELVKVLDLSGQAAFVKGMSDVAIGWGIPELLDKLIDNVEDDTVKREINLENLLNVSSRGDLNQAVHIANNLGKSTVYGVHVDVIELLVKRYKRPKNTDLSDTELGNQMLAFFEWMNPNWDKDHYDTNITCLKFYAMANPIVTELLTHTDKYCYSALGSTINIEPPKSTINRIIPDLVGFGE